MSASDERERCEEVTIEKTWASERARRIKWRVLRGLARRVDLPTPEPSRPPLTPTREPSVDVRYRDVPSVPDDVRFVPPWPARIGTGRIGQLEPEFQRAQARVRAQVRPEDCEWYHEVELTDGERIAGAWDLIGNEHAYLGGVDVKGTRVLELGPASGHLTFHMERAGAEVVAFDAGFDASVDLLGAGDVEGDRSKIMRFIGEVQNSWWWLKSHYEASAEGVYGSIYDLPADLGRFDTTVFAAILLHLRDPYLALQQASLVTDRTVVVTDVVPGGLGDWDEGTIVFHPVEGNRNSWWQLSPALIQRMLSTLEFHDQQIFRHVQYTRPWHDLAEPKLPVEFYTIVAHR